MPRGPRIATAIAVICGAWAASCSANVDGYHLAQDTFGPGGGGEVASGSGAQSGAGAPSSGGTMTVATGGTAGTGGIGTGGIIASGGSGGSGTGGLSTGGVVGSGGVVASGGVVGSGGVVASGGVVGSGGVVASGGVVGSGGVVASGGVVGSGGVVASGGVVGSGGVVASGGVVGSGGAGGAGGAPGNPVLVDPQPAVSGITAASWRPDLNPPRFYLLEAGLNRFWWVNPATGAVTGPLSLPSGTVVPHAFGTSLSFAYVVINNAINRVAIGGSTSATAVVSLGGTTPLAATVSGASAGGYFLVGEAQSGARVLRDSLSVLETGVSLNNINHVVTDGASFAFRTLDGNNIAVASLMAAGGPFQLSSVPCPTGAGVGPLDDPLGVSGNKIAWVTRPASGACQLKSASISGSACSTIAVTTFGVVPNCPSFAGLIDDKYALVIPNVSGTVADIQVKALGGGVAPTILQGVYLGSKPPREFVMGSPRYAVLLSDDVPALISF